MRSLRYLLPMALLVFAALHSAGARSPDNTPARVDEDDTTAQDEKLVKDAGLGVEAPALLAFFRQRTLTDADRKHFAALAEQFGHTDFEKREEASRELTKRGTPVLPWLRKAVNDKDLEIARRAKVCIEEIENGPGTNLPLACARLLAKRPQAEAVSVLLAYLPHADDGEVEQGVFDAIVALNAGRNKPDVALNAALKDETPVKRAAAAFVLGRSSDKDVRAAVLPLLADKDTRVRFHAAQGLIVGRDKAAVPPLINLLVEAPPAELGDVEELLARLGGEFAPETPLTETDDGRKKHRDAWSKWWKDNAETIDLAKVNEAEPFLNLTVVPEMHANKVWECGKDGKPRWTITDLDCPIDAQVLSGGRVLVAELAHGGRVTERSREGKVLWEYKVDTPIYCQRLSNGRTFISTNHRYCIVTREGKEVMSYTPPEGNTFFMHSVQRLRNGHVVVVSMAGQIRELDALGKEVRTITLVPQSSWNGITATPKGTYLVANGAGVQEIDTVGKKVWQHTLAGACYASRLPNGNTLIVSNSSGLYEVNHEGKTVWQQPMATSLWRSHRR